jgi:diguanylate cyclase (GGDEF)-like protein/PAS domain S-box-containing protein
MDLVGMHRDGHLIPLSIALSAQESLGLKWNLAILHDLTRRHEMTRELRLLSAAVEVAASGIAITDTEAQCQWTNRAFETITGYRREEVLGQRMSILKSGVHDDAFFRELWTTITAGRTWHGEIHNRHKDGHTYVEEQTISPVHDANGEITHFIAVKHDVTARREMEQQLRTANETLQKQLAEIEILQAQLREQAIRDPLTGLFNRRYLTDYLSRHLERSRRDQYPVALVLLDLDHFKQLNDTYGHAAGDEALRVLAELLQSEIRVSDTACRYGGEEFIVIMPGVSLNVAMRRGDTLRAAYEETVIEYEGTALRGTFSAGVAVFPDHGNDGEAVLSAADQALYRAKSAGRNCVVGFGDEPDGGFTTGVQDIGGWPS